MVKFIPNAIRKTLRFITHHKIISIIVLVFLAIPALIFRPKAEAAIPVQTITPSHFTQSVSVSGTVQAKNSANLSFLAGGKLVYLGVKKGDQVQQYQTIATLDQRTAQKNLEAALNAYAEQRNAFDQTQDNNQNRTPQGALNDVMKRILENNQYDLNKAINSVDLQSLAKEQTVLTTPIAGIVTRMDVTTIGVDVTPTTTFSVVDPTSIVFDMDVDEADIGKIREGQTVDVVLDAFPDETLHEKVQSIDFVSHATSTGGTAYTVEVALPETRDYKYKIGMNGNGEIVTAEKNDVLSVPISALADNNYVYVQTGDNTFEKRKVNLGLQSDTEAEITKGLQPGEKVAVDPTNAAKHVKK